MTNINVHVYLCAFFDNLNKVLIFAIIHTTACLSGFGFLQARHILLIIIIAHKLNKKRMTEQQHGCIMNIKHKDIKWQNNNMCINDHKKE